MKRKFTAKQVAAMRKQAKELHKKLQAILKKVDNEYDKVEDHLMWIDQLDIKTVAQRAEINMLEHYQDKLLQVGKDVDWLLTHLTQL